MTIQTNYLPDRNRRAQMLALGDTKVFGANMVNSFRVTWVNTKTRANLPARAVFLGSGPRHPEYLHLRARHGGRLGRRDGAGPPLLG
jgi:hypothetical protein